MNVSSEQIAIAFDSLRRALCSQFLTNERLLQAQIEMDAVQPRTLANLSAGACKVAGLKAVLRRCPQMIQTPDFAQWIRDNKDLVLAAAVPSMAFGPRVFPLVPHALLDHHFSES